MNLFGHVPKAGFVTGIKTVAGQRLRASIMKHFRGIVVGRKAIPVLSFRPSSEGFLAFSRKLLTFGSTGIAFIFLTACGGLAGNPEIVVTFPPITQAPPEAGFPQEPPDLSNGARIYAANCTRCHGTDGSGHGELVLSGEVGEPGNFRDPATMRDQTPQQWFDTITHGRLEQLMPPWRDSLSEQARWDVAYYTYTLPHTPEQIAEGQALLAAFNADLPADLRTLSETSDTALAARIAAVGIVDEAQIQAAVAYARTRLLDIGDLTNPSVSPPAATEEPAPPTAALPGETGVVTGRVINGTALGAAPADLPVTLFASDGRSATQRLEGHTDAEGGFRFEGVNINPEQAYVAVVAYQNRTFSSEFARGESATLDLPLTIYELTEDPAVITIIGMVSQITAVAEGLQVLQVMNFHNNSDRAFTSSQEVGENRYASVVVSLPPGGVILGFPEQPERYITPEDGSAVIDSVPVLPGGDHIIQYIYFLPYQAGAMIEQPFNYAFSGPARLLLRPPSVTATSEQLESLGTQTLGESTFAGYGAELNLQAGESMLYELSGIGAATADEITPPVVSSNNLVLVVLLVLVAQAVLIGGLYLYYRRREVGGASAPEDKNRLLDALAQQIAELDAAHDRGDINHDLYHHRRKQLKVRLGELMGEPEEKEP